MRCSNRVLAIWMSGMFLLGSLVLSLAATAQQDTLLVQPVQIQDLVGDAAPNRSEDPISPGPDPEATLSRPENETRVTGGSESDYVANCPSGYTNTGLTCYRGPDDIRTPSRPPRAWPTARAAIRTWA